jgi:hypothetical protein
MREKERKQVGKTKPTIGRDVLKKQTHYPRWRIGIEDLCGSDAILQNEANESGPRLVREAASGGAENAKRSQCKDGSGTVML